MSKQSSERRSYSVDEMMDKLREGQREKREREESELVTRPDGSQVMRVRRRKRRSKQPQRQKEVRRRRVGVIFAVAVVVLLVALAASVLILLARFNSKGYRDELKARLLEATGGRSGIDDLIVTPFHARAKHMHVDWSSGGIVKSLELDGLSARLDLRSFLGDDWHGENVMIDSGQLLLGPPDGTIDRGLAEGELPFNFDNYRCGRFDLLFGPSEDEVVLRLEASEVTMRPDFGSGGSTQFILNGGRAAIPGWEELRVIRALAEMERDSFRISSLHVRPASPAGDLGGEATVRSVKAMRANAPAELEVALKGYPLSELLGGSSAGCGKFFGGRIDTDDNRLGTITFDPRFMDSGAVEIAFAGSEGTLREFLFLRGLHGILKSRDYLTPTSGVISGVFRFDKDRMSLTDFRFETKALLKVEGNVERSPDGVLSGALRIGIPQGVVFDIIAAPYRPAFKPDGAGDCWITIALSGTIALPRDNFSQLLEEGAGTTDPVPTPVTPATPTDLLEDVFQRLTTPDEDGDEAPEE